ETVPHRPEPDRTEDGGAREAEHEADVRPARQLAGAHETERRVEDVDPGNRNRHRQPDHEGASAAQDRADDEEGDRTYLGGQEEPEPEAREHEAAQLITPSRCSGPRAGPP